MRTFGVIKINDVFNVENTERKAVNVSYCEYSTTKSGWFRPSYVTKVWKTSKKTNLYLNSKESKKFASLSSDTEQKAYLSSILNR